MNDNIAIHTIITKKDKEKLLIYGNNRINEGIKRLIEIAESKKISVSINTQIEL